MTESPVPEPQEGTMVHPDPSVSHTLAYAASKGWGPSRTLSALGHPGYGAAFATRALAVLAARGCSTHEAVYGLMLADERSAVIARSKRLNEAARVARIADREGVVA